MKFFHSKDAKEITRKSAQQSVGKSNNTATAQNPNFPPPKTDKPRPHVCGTCSRSFARLEHLKRHERSHTKEKPFECAECSRCFARRDLLLRHQQKLHMSSALSSRPRAGRRESTSSVSGSGPGRVRKSSIAGGGSGAPGAPSVRPRANTISHVDGATLGMFAANSSHFSSLPGLAALHGPGGFEFRGMSSPLGHHGNFHGLPKLETHRLSIDIGGGLRTAPPYGNLTGDVDIGHIFFPPGPTVNPAQLHFSDSPHAHPMMTPSSPFQHAFPGMSASQVLMDDESYDWIGFENHAAFSGQNENAMEGSSPSAISSASQSGISEVMLDGSNNPAQTSGQLWAQNPMMPPATMASSQFPVELPGTTFSEMNAPGTISPNGNNTDSLFSTPPPMNALSPTSVMSGLGNQFFHPPMVYGPETPSTSSASMNGSTRKTSVASVSADSITDATRHALLISLSQPPTFAHNPRTFSTSSTSSSLSPAFGSKPGNNNVSLPSTADLQRYVGSYIQYFHPHLPFLHLPTLTFNAPEYTDNLRPSTNHPGFNRPNISGGGGCLILAMAAIGALFEYESAVSLELFESAKKLIHLFLEERRKADISRSKAGTENSIQNTPLWLVQAMLLNVVYGHNCGDKVKSDIATTHCAALVSLARAAGLPTGETPQSLSYSRKISPLGDHLRNEDIRMGDDGLSEIPNEQTEWYNWKDAEERKRTCYAVFILSSLLVSAYNMAPAFASSEIRLDLPCDEDLWNAENPAAWYAKGGATLAQHNAVSFSGALTSLLSADQRQAKNQQMSQPYHQALNPKMQNGVVLECDLKPSAFGCLVLINALHNYIWEMRQRHDSSNWSVAETEAIHAHMEPALKAWRAAWASNSHHSVERPNPFGLGPLSADSIPLLDLAYVRLFVNLGRSKECFWQRDFEGMAEELARGSETVRHADHSPGSLGSDVTDSHNSTMSLTSSPGSPISSSNLNSVRTPTPSHSVSGDQMNLSGQISKREKHLRKAACYAAGSLSMCDKLGVTLNSRELPLQCALCAFECAQVLSEWVATVQERVGRFLGILGRDPIDYGAVPAIMLLDSEDCKLLEKIAEVLDRAEVKTNNELGSMGGIQSLGEWGYGGKILRVTACMLDKASVWPAVRIAGQALRVQADHMESRAKNSVPSRD